MRAATRVRAMQTRAATLHTLTLDWYSDSGATTTVGGMKKITPTLEGSCAGRVQARSRMGGDTLTRMVKVGGVELPVMQGSLHIGVDEFVDSTGLRLKVGWECKVAKVGPADDPALLGRRYRVVDVPSKTHLTQRRLDVVDITHLAGA